MFKRRPSLLSPCVHYPVVCLCFLHRPVCQVNTHYLKSVFEYPCVCVFCQEADGDDRLGLQGDAEGEGDGDSKADTPDVPLSTADTDNTPQCLNKALEGLPPRYAPLKHTYTRSRRMPAAAVCS